MITNTLESPPLSNILLPIFKSELTNGIELRVLGTPENPWFIAKDVAIMLEYKDTKKAIKAHIESDYILTYEQLNILDGG
jgi:hypothetical protein